MRKFKITTLLTLAIASISVVTADACSVCRCGDNGCQFSDQTLTASSDRSDRRFRVSLANSYSSKSNALGPDEGVGDEKQSEVRPSLKASYRPNENFNITAEIPLSFKRLEVVSDDGKEISKSSGIGDAEITGAWMSNLHAGLSSTISAGLSAALKVPSGQNNLQSNSERREEHLQAGSGSYDYTLGGGLVMTTFENRMFASFYYRHNGTNKYDYHYGHATLYNLGIQRGLTSWLDGLLQFNARYARPDLENNEIVENTGGWVGYLTPGVRFALGNAGSFSASVQIPVWQDLHGDQSEKAVLLTGFTVGI
jgi:hypothetical protein